MNDVTPDDCKPKIDWGDHAFPRPASHDQQRSGVDDHPGNAFWDQEGMYLRDYFAAKALSGLNTSANALDVAKTAYRVADAMIAERSKK
jgi:hypothetical protein